MVKVAMHPLIEAVRHRRGVRELCERSIWSNAVNLGRWVRLYGILRELCEQGANVNAQSLTGLTALMWASGHGYVEMVRILCDKGALLDLEDKDGDTALGCAVMSRELDCVEELCKRGARSVGPIINHFLARKQGVMHWSVYDFRQLLTKQC